MKDIDQTAVNEQFIEELRQEADSKQCLLCSHTQVLRQYRYDLLFVKDKIACIVCADCYFVTRSRNISDPYKIVN